MKSAAAVICLLMTSALGVRGVSDSSFKNLQDEGRSSFTPTSTNAHAMPRPAPPQQPMIYAQSRDSYSNAAPQQTYSVPAGGGTQGGTAAAASSSYGAPATGGGYGAPGQQSMTYYYYHYPAQHGGGGGYGDTSGKGCFHGFGLRGRVGNVIENVS